MNSTNDSSGSDGSQTASTPRTWYRVPTGQLHGRVDQILDASPTTRPTVKMSKTEREGILAQLGKVVRSLLPSGKDD